MAEILVIDDEAPIRETLKEILEYENYTVTTADDGNKGLQLIQKNEYDVVLCDVKMPGIDGMELLDRAQALRPDLPFIMISGHGNVEMAIDATKKGAYDFITKPPDLNRLLISIRNAIDKNNLVTETKFLKRKVSKTFDIIGETPAIGKIKEVYSWVGVTGNERTRLFQPPPSSPVPANLNWDLWIGAAPMREYAQAYHPFIWRDWQDFGGGGLGDFGCHIMDPVFTALELTAPISVIAKIGRAHV